MLPHDHTARVSTPHSVLFLIQNMQCCILRFLRFRIQVNREDNIKQSTCAEGAPRRLSRDMVVFDRSVFAMGLR